MAQEFFRSFRKNLFKDIILMVIFSICSVMIVLMGSYYLDLGERYADSAQYYNEEGIWYSAGLELFTDRGEMLNNLDTISGCRNVITYCEEIRNLENHPLMSVATQQTMLVKESFAERFGDKNFERFLSEDHPAAFMASFGRESCSVLDIKSVQLDFRAFQLFGLRTEEGEGFTEANTSIRHFSDPIPVILGYEYKGYFSVGDVIDIGMTGTEYVYSCRVAGILQRGSQIPEFGYITQDMVSLDPYILFPYGIRVPDRGPVELEEIKKYAFLDITALGNSSVQVSDEKEFKELVICYRDKGLDAGLPPLRLHDASIGLNLLRKESAASVRIMLVLTAVLFCFFFYSLFVAFYDKVQSGQRVYGIYLMNGCPVWMILFPCLLEAIVILAPSVPVCRWVFSYEHVGTGANIEVIIRAGYCVTALSFVVSAVFLIYLMRGVDTERLVRQTDL